MGVTSPLPSLLLGPHQAMLAEQRPSLEGMDSLRPSIFVILVAA